MNADLFLKSFLRDLEWFEKGPRTLDQAKDYIFNRSGFRHIHIRTYHDMHKTTFFRVRSLGINENEETSLHAYPPLEFNRLGRANLKSKQVLYCAGDPVTAIYEYLNTGTLGGYIYLSTWKLKDQLSVPTFNIMKNPDHTNYMDQSGRKIDYPKQIMDKLFDTMIRLFNRSNQYEFSASFSHFLLYKTDICKMIRYPSVTTKAISYCNAINVDFFDENFVLEKVYKIKVHAQIKPGELEGINIPGVITSDVSVSKPNNGKLKFSDLTDEDIKFWEYYFMEKQENGTYEFKR